MLDGGGVCVVSGTVNGSFHPPIRSHTMLTWIKQQIKRWLVFSSQRPSVSCWEVFQATFLKFLHTADDITLQKNRNETNLEGKGGMQICVWKPISCIHYWKGVWDKHCKHKGTRTKLWMFFLFLSYPFLFKMFMF